MINDDDRDRCVFQAFRSTAAIVENLTRSLEDFDDSKDYTRHVLSASVKRVVEKVYDKMIDARIDDELRVHDDLAVKEIFDS